MFISGIYALKEEINKTESGLSTGAVDIELKEYNKHNQPFDEDGKHVMPGDEIILIPRVNNLGIECYLRAKIEYYIEDEVFSVTDYIEGNYSSWTKSGEYYYYGSVFPREGSIDLFNKVIIPNLSSEYYGKIIVVHIVVEAIQAKHFDGNWEDVEIKASVDRSYDIDYEGESSVIYDDDVYHHITLDDAFFNQLGNMLPGDSVSETVKLLNSSNSRNKYYLSIEYDNLTPEEFALLQHMKLKVRNQNGDIIIDSNLADKNRHTLGIYAKGKGDTFTIEVSLPRNIDNDFSKILTKIVWRFSYDVLDGRVVPNPDTGIINPYTGDINLNLSITVFLLSAIGFLVVLFLGKQETEKYRKKYN